MAWTSTEQRYILNLENQIQQLKHAFKHTVTKREVNQLLYTLKPTETQSETIITTECDDTLNIGDCVYLTNVYNNRHVAHLANPLEYSKMPAIGIVIQKIKSTECNIQLSGIVKNIYTDLTDRKLLFVNNLGRVGNSPPFFQNENFVFLQNIGQSLSSNTILLTPCQLMTKLIK